MSKSSKKSLIIIILTLIIGFSLGYIIFSNHTEPKEIIVEKIIENTEKIDSLNSVIKTNEELIKSLKDSVKEKIIYVEKKIDDIKKLPIDSNLMLLRDNLLVYGENFEITDSLPSLCQIDNSKDTVVMLSETNLVDINTVFIKYEGELDINDYYSFIIEEDSAIISLKDSIIWEKDNIINNQRKNFESNMKDLELIVEKERRKQIYYTIGGVVAAGTITYLIMRK